MSRPPPEPDAAVRAAAAAWTVRRDRGLSAAESIDYELWLAADPRHAAAMQRSAAAWSLLDRIPESAAAPVVAAATRRRAFWRRPIVLGAGATLAAAAAAVALLLLRPAPPAAAAAALPAVAAAAPRLLTLADGSVVHLNTGGEIRARFTAGERRVELVRGEAHFAVAKDPARPFVVHAGNLDVRAVGTAFNVQLQSGAVDVLVTAGTVQLGAAAEPAPAFARVAREPIPLLRPGHRAVVSLAPVTPATAVVVTTATADEISRTLAWQAPLLRLGGATLAEVAREFERRSGRRVVLADPELAALRLGGRFRADDLDGFTHLLATTFDLAVEHSADGSLVLRKKTSGSR
jgi:transmembrane sensor